MFKSGTVIVLGAAVSAEVDMPLGGELKDRIGTLLPKSNGGGNDYVRSALFASGQTVEKNRLAALALAAALPRALSIDNLVEHRGQDEAFKFVAKVGIIAAILQAEGRSQLCRARGEPLGRISTKGSTTYGAIFSIMLSGVSVDLLEEAISRVSFINFNYDRCLEHYFRDWLIAYSGVPEAEASRLACRLDVVRPYGRLAPLHWMGEDDPLDFGEGLERVELAKHVGNILTFSEERGSQIDMRVRDLTGRAHQLILLGCAFHRQNVELLRPETTDYRYAWGTCYMLPPKDEHSRPSLDSFAQPTIQAFEAELDGWARNPLLSSYRHQKFEALTSLQLIEKYRATWTAPRG